MPPSLQPPPSDQNVPVKLVASNTNVDVTIALRTSLAHLIRRIEDVKADPTLTHTQICDMLEGPLHHADMITTQASPFRRGFRDGAMIDAIVKPL